MDLWCCPSRSPAASKCDCLRAQEFWYQAERDLKGGAGDAGLSATPDEKSDMFLE
jgi:hypothetical protein